MISIEDIIMNTSTIIAIFIWLIFVFIYFYLHSNTIRYFTKFLVCTSIWNMSCIILMPLAILKPNDYNHLHYLSRLCKISSLVVGIKWKIKGTEYLAKAGACIIVANHQSLLDVQGLFHIWPYMKNGSTVVKEELLYLTGVFGFYLWLTGSFLIPRSNREKCKEILSKALEIVQNDEVQLLIFPEGTRRNDGTFNPFKKGAFHMALSAQIPIVPVVFSRYYFINDNEKIFGTGEMSIEVLPPIPTKGKSLEDVDKVIKETRDKMILTFNKLNKYYELNKNILVLEQISE